MNSTPLKPIRRSDFRQGRRDCKAGRPHQQHKSTSYDAGYARQYAREQRAQP
jgi:hypothetical protein